jgi:hypothetical protein
VSEGDETICSCRFAINENETTAIHDSGYPIDYGYLKCGWVMNDEITDC